jgi:hypothetical protein
MREALLEAILNEHDLNVPERDLAAPLGFGAHRKALKVALDKYLPDWHSYQAASALPVIDLRNVRNTLADFVEFATGSRIGTYPYMRSYTFYRDLNDQVKRAEQAIDLLNHIIQQQG